MLSFEHFISQTFSFYVFKNNHFC